MIRRPAPLFSLCLALLAPLAGCGTPTAVTDGFVLGEPFSLREGTTLVSTDRSTAVRFVSVVTDSRCPGGDIVCIWEGEAIIALEVWNPLSAGLPAGVNAAPDPSGTAPAGDGPGSPVMVPRADVKVGAAEPVVVGGRRVEALALEPHRSPSSTRPREARLRISLVP